MNEEIILNELEWQKWLTDYTALRSKAFLRLLEDRERKSSPWKM